MTVSDGASTLDLTPGSVGAPRHKTADMFGRLSQQTDVSEQIRGLDLRGDVRRTLTDEPGGSRANRVAYQTAPGDQLANAHLRASNPTGNIVPELATDRRLSISSDLRRMSTGQIPDPTGS